MKVTRRRGISGAKLVVVIMLVGAVVFSLFLGYLEYANQSFPSKQKPFSEYASVAQFAFNGTEVYYRVQWMTSGNYTPLFAQITSNGNDEANSPVCDLELNSSATRGQVLEMPFAIVGGPTTALSDVELSIAVRANANMSEFTIQYPQSNVAAQPGDIMPSTFSCNAGEQNPAM